MDQIHQVKGCLSGPVECLAVLDLAVLEIASDCEGSLERLWCRLWASQFGHGRLGLDTPGALALRPGRCIDRSARLYLPVSGFLGQTQTAQPNELGRLGLVDLALMVHHATVALLVLLELVLGSFFGIE